MSTLTQPVRATGARPEASGSPLDAVLDGAQSNRSVIQEFCPLAKSLEWELGQESLRARGSLSFLADARPVPWYVNNDSTLSRNAADVLYEALVVSDQQSAVSGQSSRTSLGFSFFSLDIRLPRGRIEGNMACRGFAIGSPARQSVP